MRPRLLAMLPLLALPVLAGCGSAPSYALDATRSCLAKEGLKITKPTGDVVAETATRGTFRAHLDGPDRNFVTLSFGADGDEAASVAEGYERFHAKNIGVSDILAVDKNVVMLWRQHPSPDEESEVTDCLK